MLNSELDLPLCCLQNNVFIEQLTGAINYCSTYDDDLKECTNESAVIKEGLVIALTISYYSHGYRKFAKIRRREDDSEGKE